ncbi:F-box protein SKIP19 [Morus notabilis]|uniref:F-box protein SKIP19 n=1 Tax=Morus notabilis TaxID=981085 RepID=W9QES0_9ROSA|nr:F-box protein SKIP19 [Morus notabilis]EXB31420.1 F-box protein SKIP19 [Morus notabilis]
MASSSSGDDDSSSKEISSSSGVDSSEEQLRNWLELPREVTASIFSRLVATEILNNTQFVCKSWFDICKDPLVWRKINMYNIGEADLNMELDRMCRHAVDRSRGNLVDINIEYLGNDGLLKHITDSCGQVKRLRLACCYNVSNEGLIEAIAKLPLLEELDLSLCAFSTEPLETVGRHCPRLRSLKLHCQAYRSWFVDPDMELEINEEAIGIAKHIPELRHLQLLGNPMTNMGLQAILDGCPHLESLDLRRCLSIDLKGKLGQRCKEQIKYLRLPHESTEDLEFRIGPDDDGHNAPNDFSDDGSFDEDYGSWYSSVADFVFDEYLDGEFDDYPDFDSSDGSLDYDDFTVPENF